MRTVLLNLPSNERVFRCYMCSYNSPNSLFPPIELMALAGIPIALTITLLADSLLSHFPEGYEGSAGVLQILRVTPYGSSAILLSRSQAAITIGMDGRVTAKMP